MEKEQQKKALIEATLFMAAKPMSAEEISAVTNIPADEITALLAEMSTQYSDHGIRVVEHEVSAEAQSGSESTAPTSLTSTKLFELHIKDEFVSKVAHLAPTADFSRGLLQSLSLIAYKAPLKQSEVVKIRGNRAYEHMKDLEERGFVHREPKGHTKIITLTRKFVEYFGLGNLEELKEKFEENVAEMKATAQEKEKSGKEETRTLGK